MKKADAKAKVEPKVEPKKRKGKSSKVPLLMGLGLPVLRKRFLNSFQDEWADYASWGIDKRWDDGGIQSEEEEYLDFESAKENFEPAMKKKRRLGSEKKKR